MATPTPVPFPLQDEEEVKLRLENVRCSKPKVDVELGRGLLFVTTKRVVWGMQKDGSFTVECQFSYHDMVFHAKTEPPMHAIMVQLDSPSVSEEAEEEEETPDNNVWFFPSTQDEVDPLFNAMAECSSMNPDDMGEDEGEAEMFSMPEIGDGDGDGAGEGDAVETKHAADDGVGSTEDRSKCPRMSGEQDEEKEDDEGMYGDAEEAPKQKQQ